jgi:hypothetical protein
MTWDGGRRRRRSGDVGASRSGAVRRSSRPQVEPLEGRALLSFYTGPAMSRPVLVGNSFFTVAVTGGGFQTVRLKRNGHAIINLTGTGPNSVLTIGAATGKPHFSSSSPLQIDQINVKSGSIGAIQAPAANLVGSLILPGSVNLIAFNEIGPNAKLQVGSVGALAVGDVDLGPTGLVQIPGGLGGSTAGSGAASSIGSLEIDGGQFIVGGVNGPLTVGSVSLQRGGQVFVSGDLTGGLTVSGDFQATTDGQLVVAGSVTGSPVTAASGTATPTTPSGAVQVGGKLELDSGRIIVGKDMSGGLSAGSMDVRDNGALSVGRDFSGGLDVLNGLTLASQGKVAVGRDLGALIVGGDLHFDPDAGAIGVSGNLTGGATIGGVFQGHGNGQTDLAVGLDLDGLTIAGGQPNLGGLQNAVIAVGKSLLGLNIVHGIFNSRIDAGVLIDGNGTQPTGGNIGPDGTDAVFDSQIIAGVQINHLTIGGDVRSDFVTNPHPTGYPTRIIAGENPQGQFSSGGNIDNFQITGALIDSVVAASVQPFGGDGTLPPSGYTTQASNNNPGDGGFNTYDAPAGMITGGPVTAPVSYANWTPVNVFNETVTGTAWNTTIDPTIDDLILPGSINASFASAPLSQAQLSSGTVTITSSNGSAGQSTTTQTSSPTGTTISSTSTNANGQTSTSSITSTQTVTLNLPLPTKSTVLGGVISTSHGDNPDASDFAGLFAADARGVFVGTLPPSAGS